MRRGLTVIEVVVAVVALLVIFALLVPIFLVRPRTNSLTMIEGANLSSLGKALAVYGYDNKGYFPGLTAAGDYTTKPFQGKHYGATPNAGGEAEEKSGDGCAVAKGTNLVLALLLDDDNIAPKQLISPYETGETSGSSGADIQEAPRGGTGTGVAPVTEVGSNHFSHAMLAYGRPNLKQEWKDNQSEKAVILSSRLIFGDKPGKFHSLRTDPGSGRFEGSVVHGDFSVSREKFQSGRLASDGLFRNLKYGEMIFDAQSETSSVVGIFGRSTDMKNFDATPTTGVVGSAND